MVGNDVGEDMIAEKLGIKVFLLTDCLINKDGEDIDRWPHGGFDALLEYCKKNSLMPNFETTKSEECEIQATLPAKSLYNADLSRF